jgi:hypothetical protein
MVGHPEAIHMSEKATCGSACEPLDSRQHEGTDIRRYRFSPDGAPLGLDLVTQRVGDKPSTWFCKLLRDWPSTNLPLHVRTAEKQRVELRAFAEIMPRNARRS